MNLITSSTGYNLIPQSPISYAHISRHASSFPYQIISVPFIHNGGISPGHFQDLVMIIARSCLIIITGIKSVPIHLLRWCCLMNDSMFIAVGFIIPSIEIGLLCYLEMDSGKDGNNAINGGMIVASSMI